MSTAIFNEYFVYIHLYKGGREGGKGLKSILKHSPSENML